MESDPKDKVIFFYGKSREAEAQAIVDGIYNIGNSKVILSEIIEYGYVDDFPFWPPIKGISDEGQYRSSVVRNRTKRGRHYTGRLYNA